MNNRERRVRTLVNDFGFDEIEARFAVALADGETTGSPRVITLPLPEEEARRQARILSEQHFFTPEEAARYVAGDRSMMDAIAERAAEYWRRVDAGLESPSEWEARRSAARSVVTAR